jgi:hypothetical protein
MLSTLDDNNEIMDLYLAKKLPPSGIDFSDNAYILNLGSPVGGYLDGCALTTNEGRRLDDSPSACGHLVNHYGRATNTHKPNVQVVTFLWNDIFQSDSFLVDESLPNTMRCDGFPWYFDAIEQKIIYFPNQEEADVLPDQYKLLIAGAAITSPGDSPISLEPGEELFLDYQLRSKALPKWATDWYK